MAGDSTSIDSPAIEALDRALLRVRRAMVRPIITAIPLPSLGRTCDLAKVLACETVAALTPEEGGLPGSPPSVKDVALAMQLDHSTASRLLGEAEAEGFVARGTDRTDRRRTTVALTDLGRALVADAGVIRRWTLAETFADWQEADVRALAGYLQRVAETFDARGEEVKNRAHERFGVPGPAATA